MDLASNIKSMGTLSLINFVRKHLEKLRQSGKSEIVPIADAVEAAMTSLDTAYSARRPLVSLWRDATAKKDAADDALDRTIAELSYELLGPKYLKGDRSSATYRALFPAGTIGFINGPDRAEVVQVNAMASYLKANPDHPMADRAATLETQAAILDAALAPVVAAESLLRSTEAIERDKRDELCRALRKSAALLRAELMDERKVEAFFPTIAESKVEEDDSTSPAQ